MLLFIDTEFTGLGQQYPRLISIGLVSEDGLQTFYAELQPDSYMERATDWVKANVLPLLNGGHFIMSPDALRKSLAEWIGTLGPVKVATDSRDYDHEFLRAILAPWPANVDPEPFVLNINYMQDIDKFHSALEKAFTSGGLRRHHALDDAKANRLGWLAAGGAFDWGTM